MLVCRPIETSQTKPNIKSQQQRFSQFQPTLLKNQKTSFIKHFFFFSCSVIINICSIKKAKKREINLKWELSDRTHVGSVSKIEWNDESKWTTSVEREIKTRSTLQPTEQLTATHKIHSLIFLQLNTRNCTI